MFTFVGVDLHIGTSTVCNHHFVRMYATVESGSICAGTSYANVQS